MKLEEKREMTSEAEGTIYTEAQRQGKKLARLRDHDEFVAASNMWLFKFKFIKIRQN